MRKVILILLLTIAPNLFSQPKNQEYKIVDHTVMMGESVRMLSKKYLVPPSEIYRLNKFAVDGIKEGMVLKIPVPIKDEPVVEEAVSQTETPVSETPVAETQPVQAAPAYENQSTEHRVQSGETISGLAQQYAVTVQAIKDANPKVAKRGLRTDEVIIIPPVMPSDDFVNEVMGAAPGKTDVAVKTTSSASEGKPVSETQAVAVTPETSGSTTHRVKSGETLSVLAQKYGVTLKQLKDANPKVAKCGLRADETINIPSAGSISNTVTSVEVVESAPVKTEEPPVAASAEQTTQIEAPATETPVASGEVIEHKVKPGETLFGLSRKYNVSVDVIKKQNARSLAHGLQVGQVIKIKPE
ncbi:MAG: LysM peptidoglycan-binding domain-containing protein [Flavobacterium sp.]|uniref:LysM peptidoglycan-binding domain-containing protein n=1 Tax=Flavobacterium sp. TaxID=239 RepID=UPI0011FD06F7|nr:LysM peptidoglycan-binding domain-containing protein [Flavobacterium sp.]RZJ67434.1 MAG: LysM peptidoglycan-binding domain-containing protein [Flavobacterium sp.]